jgi:hypothetical protein
MRHQTTALMHVESRTFIECRLLLSHNVLFHSNNLENINDANKKPPGLGASIFFSSSEPTHTTQAKSPDPNNKDENEDDAKNNDEPDGRVGKWCRFSHAGYSLFCISLT